MAHVIDEVYLPPVAADHVSNSHFRLNSGETSGDFMQCRVPENDGIMGSLDRAVSLDASLIERVQNEKGQNPSI